MMNTAESKERKRKRKDFVTEFDDFGLKREKMELQDFEAVRLRDGGLPTCVITNEKIFGTAARMVVSNLFLILRDKGDERRVWTPPALVEKSAVSSGDQRQDQFLPSLSMHI
ncbi:unnamed protein product [Phaeothamnion confervicola]